MSETGLQTDERLPDEVKRIIGNECRWKDGGPIVNVKDFEIKFTQLRIESSHSIFFPEGDIANDPDKERFVEWVKRDDKPVKILPLIVTSNIYLLAILATLSTMLSVLIKEGEKDIGDIGIDFLVGKGLTKHSDFIKKPFHENYKRIIPDFYENDNNLTTMIEINFSELKSLLNILIVSLEIEGVDLRKIINRVNHTDIKNYCRENVKISERIKQAIEDWTSNRRDELSDEVGKRKKEIIFNEKYDMTTNLLKIVTSFLQSRANESGNKFILVITTLMKAEIKEFFKKWDELNLDNGRLDDVMFVSYTDPTGPEDPEVIVESIPAYLTILSKYLNSQEIVYAIDEYFHSKMMDATKSRKFQCENFHEKIMSEMRGDNPHLPTDVDILKEYADEKKKAILILQADPTKKNMEKYIKIQKKELEVINDGFLTVQSDILEQLKLIL